MSRKAPIPTPRIIPPNSYLVSDPAPFRSTHSLVDKGRGGTVIGIEWEGRRRGLVGGFKRGLTHRKDVERVDDGSTHTFQESGSTQLSHQNLKISSNGSSRCDVELKTLLIEDRPLKYSASDEYTSNQGSTSSHSSTNEENDADSSIPDLMGLDLSTLITSVEQDIQLLEQLEVRTSSGRRGSLPLPLSCISAELLSLPGYRPSPNLRKDSSGEWYHDTGSTDSFTEAASTHTQQHHHQHTQQRQRHQRQHKRSNSQVISSTTNLLPDLSAADVNKMKSTVEPVLNPGYDALLYRRLYNSPPPPLPPKAARMRRNSDSAVSDCSPPSPPSPATPGSPGEALLAERLTAHTAALPRDVYCPLCIAVVHNPDQLHTHLLASHSQDLHLLRHQDYTDFEAETCPCCGAQFLKKGLGLRHLVHHHSQFICGLFSPALTFPSPTPTATSPTSNPSSRSLPSTPPPHQRHTFCRVCGQKFLLKQVRLLSLHYHQKHIRQLNNVLSRISPISQDSCFYEEDSPRSDLHQEPGANYQNAGAKPPSNKTIEKQLFIDENRSNSKCDNTTGDTLATTSTRRRLATPPQSPFGRRSRIPTATQSPMGLRRNNSAVDSPSQHCYETVDTPLEELQTQGRGLSHFLGGHGSRKSRKLDSSTIRRTRRCSSSSDAEKRDRTPQRNINTRSFRRPSARDQASNHETYQGLPQPEPPALPITGIGSESNLLEPDTLRYSYARYGADHLFRCNLCGDRFSDNDILLMHLKSRHLAVSRALKPQYSCGQCPAKFFKNTFLLKHSLTHDTSKLSNY